ncbi:MAG: coenzyme F420-0:L-glutamate ligase [Candidatus Odinarchaeota archaeon]
MILYPIRTPLIKEGDSLIDLLIEVMAGQRLFFEEHDILVIAESPLGLSQGRVVKLSEVEPSAEAEKLAAEYDMEPELVEVVLREADKVLGGVKHVLLTLKDGVFQANAGVDKSNAPPGFVTLLPADPCKTAEEIRLHVKKRFNVNIGVIIADSRTQPLRLGNIGLAVGVAGIIPVKDERGHRDLFGRPLRITRRAIADNIASAAELLMGEADESTPAVLVREAPVEFTERRIKMEELLIPPEECLYVSVFRDKLGL